MTPEELRQSVRTFRDPSTTDARRQEILAWWAAHDTPNQFAAMLRAAQIESTS